jgi:hypothetical protein
MATKTTFMSSRRPTLKEAQKIAGGCVQMITLADGAQMLVEQDGRTMAGSIPRR